MVIADDTRQLPLAAVLLPDVQKLRGLGHAVGLAALDRVEVVPACLDGAVVVQRIDAEAAGDELAARAEIGSVADAGAMLRDILDEFRSRGLHQAVLVVEELEVVGDEVLQRRDVAAAENDVEYGL